MASGIVKVNGTRLWYDRLGKPEQPAFLLISGAHGQAIAWSVYFCEMLAERGFQVVRFDQRGTGHSGASRSEALHATDLASDAVGLLDALSVHEAHVAGISAGAIFAQYLAAGYPKRVLSLISLMGTSGDVFHDSRIDPPSKALSRTGTPKNESREKQVQRMVETFRDRLTGSRFPLNEEIAREYARSMIDRGGIAGDAPHLLVAAAASLPVPAEKILAPTLVIHGTADPLMSYSAGLSTVRAIPGARLLTVKGMGHDLMSPRAFSLFVEAFAHHAQTAPPLELRASAPR